MAHPKQKILCIDDEIVFLNNMSEFLAHNGYDVSKAHNAQTAIEQIRKHRPDIILCDIKMPDQDGIDLIAKIKYEILAGCDGPMPRVIFLTAMDKASYQMAARHIGCEDYLIKPVDFGVLLTAIEAPLDMAA